MCFATGVIHAGHVSRTAVVATCLVASALVAAGCSSSGGSAASAPPSSPTTAAAVASGAPVPSSGCSEPAGPEVANQRQNLEVGGTQRWYLLTTPAPTTPSPTAPVGTPTTTATETPIPRPLVVDFHGLAEGATIHSITTGFGSLGQRDGFVAVFPNGTGTPVMWDTTHQGASNSDLAFVTALLDQVESTQCIDTSRVYASGFSDGSFMVSLLACTMSKTFTAIGAVSGLQLPKPCATDRRVPIVTFHGTADPILYFNGGIGTAVLAPLFGGGKTTPSSSTTTTTTRPANLHGAGYPATVQAWAVKDGCNPTSTDTKLSSQVILRTYRCPAGTDIEFYIVLGGGHAWPGSAFSRSITSLTGFTTFQINATDVMWSFFERYRL